MENNRLKMKYSLPQKMNEENEHLLFVWKDGPLTYRTYGPTNSIVTDELYNGVPFVTVPKRVEQHTNRGWVPVPVVTIIADSYGTPLAVRVCEAPAAFMTRSLDARLITNAKQNGLLVETIEAFSE